MEAARATTRREEVRTLVGLGLAGVPILLLLAARPWGILIPRAFYLPLHATLEALVVAAGIATFAVQWFAAGAGAFREARARFIGPAFLGASLLALAHLLVFPGMPGIFGPATTERGIYYWLASRLFMVGALLLAARIDRASDSPLLARRWVLLVATLAAVSLIVGLETLLPADRSWFFREGRGLTGLKVTIEALVAVACAAGAVAHGNLWRITRERAAGKLAASLLLGVYAEACLMLYANPYDLFNVAGHVYVVASFAFVFDALFGAALVRPYRELDALRAHVEDELVVTIRRLREATEQREDLLRAVSHDIRNPLQIVVLQAQRLLRGPGEERTRRAAAGVLTAARRIDRMLRDLADSAKAESGRIELAWAQVPLRAFVDQMLDTSDGVFDVARVVNEIPADLPPVLADPDRLDRILANLVGNALKYSHHQVHLRADLGGDGEHVRISVSDRGPGIDGGDLPRIFERYYRGQRHEGEGLGLGLYIVRKLVEAHGGSISAESRLGEGSTFTFTLPASPPGASAAQA
jgi:signal transduction histidine kinase